LSFQSTRWIEASFAILRLGELFEAVKEAEIIENYPDDKYGPSCLLLGFTASGRPLHIQCSYPSRSLLKIITIYEPESESWIDFRIRKS